MNVKEWITDEWRQAWKWLSVQLGLLIFAAPTLYANVEVVRDFVSPNTFHIVQAGLGILVVLNALRAKKAA